MTHEILLYYIYTNLEQPDQIVEAQRRLCQRLHLTGRIIVATEGINGTVEGLKSDTDQYVEAFLNDPQLATTDFKRSIGTGHAFPKLSVKLRSEIVSAHLEADDVNPQQQTGRYLEAKELYQCIHSDKEFYIVDMRNDYEHAVGYFAHSILPKMHHFRQLPEILPELEHLKGKTVVTVCTGGVRCEKASGFLIQHGFAQVYQLRGGIVTYMEEYPHEDFHGALYVFDGRITMAFSAQHALPRVVVGQCEICGSPAETYINCANNTCHRHFICCATCQEEQNPRFCQMDCLRMSITPASLA